MTADDLALALRLADEASALALDHLDRGPASWRKADGSTVTRADVEVERLLSSALAAERPGDAVLGEEQGAEGDGPRRWIIDPIDGTDHLLAGRPDWGVHLALQHDGEIVIGVVTRPVLGRRWWASRGGGAFVGDLGDPAPRRRLRVSSRSDVARARVGGWFLDDDPLAAELARLPSWVDEPFDLDAPLRVAEGELDVLVDATPSRIWDRAPLVVLVEEAGGRYRDRRGGGDLEMPGGLFTNGVVDADLDRFLAR